jgi:hypothetical protein
MRAIILERGSRTWYRYTGCNTVGCGLNCTPIGCSGNYYC